MRRYYQIAANVMCAGVCVVLPVLIILARLERGYWAFGGEYMSVFVFIIIAVSVIEYGKEAVKKTA